jgi:NADH dehydrogenase
MTVLVVGGTGRLGRLVADQLLTGGHRVRVMSRGLEVPAPETDPRIEVVVADVRDSSGVAEAMQGVTVVVSAVQGFAGPGRISPASVDRDGNGVLVQAARRAGADVVLVSMSGAAVDASMELSRMKFAAEQALWTSGCPGTVIRPAAFVQTWLQVLSDSAGRSHRPKVLGRGDNPIPWVDVSEVAALVARAVDDPGLRGRTLDLVGPERLTLDQLARVMMEGLGWPGTPQRVPRGVVRTAAWTVGLALPKVRRICLAALAMDELSLPDDHETRALFPDLAATPSSRLAAAPGSSGSK